MKALDSAPRLPHGVPTNATTLEVAQKPWPWPPSPAIPQQQCPQAHHQGCSAGAHLPCGPGSDAGDSSDLRATGSDNKGAQVAPLADGGGGNGWFPVIARVSSGERKRNVCAIAPPIVKQKAFSQNQVKTLYLKNRGVGYSERPGRGRAHQAPWRTTVTLDHGKKTTVLQKPNLSHRIVWSNRESKIVVMKKLNDSFSYFPASFLLCSTL